MVDIIKKDNSTTVFKGRISTAEAVVNHIKQQLVDGTIKSGDQLPGERQLREEFGISRFSLREGLARLNALGIIRIVHGKGAFVASGFDAACLHNVMLPWFAGADSRQIEDLVQARLLIEREVAALAARRRTPEDLVLLTSVVDESVSAIVSPDAFAALDYRFHVRIAIIGGNVFLEKMLGIMHEHLQAFLLVHAQTVAARQKALAEHRMILAAIVNGDSDSVGLLMHRHIKGCKKNYDVSRGGRQ